MVGDPIVDFYSQNLDITGYVFHGELGYGVMMDGLGIAGFVGYGYRRLELDRSNIDSLFLGFPGINNDTFYDVHYIDFTVRACYMFDDHLSVLLEPSVGPVIASKRSQDGIDSIRGDCGLVARVEGGLEWKVYDNIMVFAGAFYDFQWLGGDDSVIYEEEYPVEFLGSFWETETLEWDEHTVDVVGGTVGVEFWF